MRPRTSFFLLALVLAGASGVWFWERKLPGTAALQEKRGLVLADLAAENVDRVVIARSGVRLVFHRAGGGWSMLEPVADRAAALEIDELVREVAQLRASATLAPADLQGGAEAAGFGQLGSISFTLQAGKQESAFEIGAAEIPGGSRYLRTAGRPEIFVVPSSLAERAGRPAAAYRDPALFSLATTAILGFSVAPRRGTELAFERRPDGGWWITRPLEDDAEDSRVIEFLGRVLGLSAEAALDQPGETHLAALTPPDLVVRLRVGDNRPALELHLGRPLHEGGARRPARVTGRPAVFEVDPGPLLELPDRPLASWATLLLLDFSLPELQEVAVTRGGKTVRAALGPPENEELIAPWSRIEALRQLAAPPAGAGLERPAARLALRFKDTASRPPVELEIGGPAGPGETYARRSGRAGCFVISTETALSIDPARFTPGRPAGPGPEPGAVPPEKPGAGEAAHRGSSSGRGN